WTCAACRATRSPAGRRKPRSWTRWRASSLVEPKEISVFFRPKAAAVRPWECAPRPRRGAGHGNSPLRNEIERRRHARTRGLLPRPRGSEPRHWFHANPDHLTAVRAAPSDVGRGPRRARGSPALPLVRLRRRWI